MTECLIEKKIVLASSSQLSYLRKKNTSVKIQISIPDIFLKEEKQAMYDVPGTFILHLYVAWSNP